MPAASAHMVIVLGRKSGLVLFMLFFPRETGSWLYGFGLKGSSEDSHLRCLIREIVCAIALKKGAGSLKGLCI